MPATLQDIQKKYGDSVYPLYKDVMHEPYMEAEKGHKGYQGVVLYNEEKDKVQCAICGEWFEQLGQHVNSHKMKADEYRRTFGLGSKVALCTPTVSKKLSDNVSPEMKEFIKKRGAEILKAMPEEKKVLNRKRILQYRREAIGFKNLTGLCRAQIEARLLVIRDIVKKGTIEELTMGEIRKYDISLAAHFQNKYKTVDEIVKKVGLTPGTRDKYTEVELISQLRSWVFNNKRIPTAKDLSTAHLPKWETYRRYFGSWRRAKEMAGLGQMVERKCLECKKEVDFGKRNDSRFCSQQHQKRFYDRKYRLGKKVKVTPPNPSIDS